MALPNIDEEIHLLVRQTTTLAIQPSAITPLDVEMKEATNSAIPQPRPWSVPPRPSQRTAETTGGVQGFVQVRGAVIATPALACGLCGPATTAAVFTAASKTVMREVEAARMARLHEMWKFRRALKERERLKEKAVLTPGTGTAAVESIAG